MYITHVYGTQLLIILPNREQLKRSKDHSLRSFIIDVISHIQIVIIVLFILKLLPLSNLRLSADLIITFKLLNGLIYVEGLTIVDIYKSRPYGETHELRYGDWKIKIIIKLLYLTSNYLQNLITDSIYLIYSKRINYLRTNYTFF